LLTYLPGVQPLSEDKHACSLHLMVGEYLVVISPFWLTQVATSPEAYVRREVEISLRRKLLVIPLQSCSWEDHTSRPK
jgi:hypothetical protein